MRDSMRVCVYLYKSLTEVPNSKPSKVSMSKIAIGNVAHDVLKSTISFGNNGTFGVEM